MKVAHLDLGVTMTADTGGYGANQAKTQSNDNATQSNFTQWINKQAVIAATIATLMETTKQLSNQVKELGAKKKPAGSKSTKLANRAEASKASHARCEQNNLAIADTAANGNFFMVNGPCTDLQPANPPIHVRLPDGSSIASTHTGLVPLP